MMDTLRKKWTFRAHGQQVVFVKNPIERVEHVLMKAFIWALYLPQYPDLRVEVSIGERFKPDVVQLQNGTPIFWGEAGAVSKQKIRKLVRKFRGTHFAMGKWGKDLRPFEAMVQQELRGVGRSAPIELICFAENSAEKFIAPNGEITITFADLQLKMLKP